MTNICQIEQLLKQDASQYANLFSVSSLLHLSDIWIVQTVI